MVDFDIERLLTSRYWRFAKTLAHIPHWYSRLQEWEDDEAFEWAVQYIRDKGVDETFHATGDFVNQYLYLGDFKYWTLGEPLEQVPLINKAEIVLGKLSKAEVAKVRNVLE